jgi:hypothetical protein
MSFVPKLAKSKRKQRKVGNFSKWQFPIIKNVFPALITPTLVEVQPMSSKFAEMVVHDLCRGDVIHVGLYTGIFDSFDPGSSNISIVINGEKVELNVDPSTPILVIELSASRSAIVNRPIDE